MVRVVRNPKETPQALVRRFVWKVQQAGILRWARKKAFRERPKSENLKREAALRREELRKKYEKLKKLGKI